MGKLLSRRGKKNQTTSCVKYSKGGKISPPNEACRAGPSSVLNELGTLWEKIPCKTLVDPLIYILCKPHSAVDTANQFVRIGDTATFSLRKIL